MYLNLGKVEKKYEAESIDDFMIISEIPNSQLSYEKPILVRTIDELNIWFGKDFDDRYYLERLINNNATLYLYKPIENKTFIAKDYINLDDYLEDEGIYAYSGSLPDVGNPEYKYWVIEDDCWYIWIEDNWYSEKNLPQNIDNQSNSLNNRDTLLITKPNEEESIIYSYPEFVIGEPELGVYSKEYDLSWNDNIQFNIDLDTQILALNIEYEDERLLSEDFIIIRSMVTNHNRNINMFDRCLFYCRQNPNDLEEYPDLGNYWDKLGWKEIETVSDLKQVYEDLGYKVSGNLIYSSYPFEFNHLYKLTNIQISPSFRDTNNIVTKYIEKKDLKCAEFWSRTIGRDKNFDDDSNIINLEIEYISENTYRITVSRYGYEEVFEGPIRNVNLGEERLDFIINKKSKLIYCTFINILDGLRTGKFVLRGSELEEQTEEMYWKSLEVMFDFNKDSIFPDYFLIPDKLKYINRFKDCIIPEPEEPEEDSEEGDSNGDGNIIDSEEDSTEEEENNTDSESEEEDDNDDIIDSEEEDIIDCQKAYEKLLEYATSYNFQVLIENNIYAIKDVDEFPEDYEKYIIYKKEEEDKVLYKMEGRDISAIELSNMTVEFSEDEKLIGDFVFNYLGDRENRLIYFYKPIITVGGYKLPGYYLYLYGLLNNIFAIDERYIIYYPPNYYPYEENNEKEKILKKYKCNYLTCNNHSYYYKEYFSGDKPISSAWMRFFVGKVAREFYKHKWSLLTKSEKEVLDNIDSILSRVENYFSLVQNILLDSFSMDALNNKLKLTVSVYISDLVSSNMTIDLTLNFNNF